MTTETVLILPESPSAGPMLDLLASLSQQRLIQRVWVMADMSESLVLLSPGEDPVPTSVPHLLGQPASGFCLVNVVSADGPEPTLDDSGIPGHFIRAQRLGSAFEAARAVLTEGAEVQQLQMINAVAPCAVKDSMSPGVFQLGVNTALGWTNVVLMAEVQSDSNAASALVTPDEEYVANTICSVLSLVGLWHSSSPPSLEMNAAAGRWHLVRTRMRLLAAPELAPKVMNRAARRDPPLPQDTTRSYRALEGEALTEAVDLAVEALAGRHHLRAVYPPTDGHLTQQKTPGLRKLVRLIRDWLRRRLPELVASEVREAGRRVVRWTEERVNGAFQTDDLTMRFSFLEGPSSEDGRERADGGVRRQRLLVPVVSPEPDLWANLRAVLFGLMDGTQLPLGLEDAVATPATRYIVCARSRLVPAPSSPLIQASDEIGRSVVGRIVELLDSGTSVSKEITADFERQLEELRASRDPKPTSVVRRVLRFVGRTAVVLLKVAAVLAVTVGLLVLPFLLPLAAVLLVAWAVVGAFVWLALMVRVIGGFVWRRFRRDFKRQELQTREQLLELGLLACKAQEDRFRMLRDIGVEWGRILSLVVHQPFGPPVISERPRAHRSELHLPGSHQVIEPMVSELRMEGVVNRVRRQLYPSGWMTARYGSLCDAVRAAFVLQAPSSTFNPDVDGLDDGVGMKTGRRVLHEALLSGSATASNEIEARLIVERALLDPNGMPGEGPLEDRLFTEAGSGVVPSAFIGEAVLGEPAKWNRELVRPGANNSVRMHRSIVRLTEEMKPSWPLPHPLSIEQVVEGQRPVYAPFILGSFCVEASLNVPSEEVDAFSDSPRKVEIDLGRANGLWKPAPPVDEGEVEHLDDDARAGLGIPDSALPLVGELVTPLRDVREPVQSGAYGFLFEVDGDPVQWDAERPVKYKVRQEAAPPNGMAIVLSCLQRVADATGMSFEFAGTSAGPPTGNHEDLILVAWATNGEFQELRAAAGLSERAIAYGGPRYTLVPGGQPALVAGIAVLNTEMACLPTAGPGDTHGAVLLHELGHVMNLAHVKVDQEVMYPFLSDGSPFEWGPGDRLGLYLSVRRRSLVRL